MKSDNQVQEDPYAWAKAKQVSNYYSTSCARASSATSGSKTSQHPGWLWDAKLQWVPIQIMSTTSNDLVI